MMQTSQYTLVLSVTWPTNYTLSNLTLHSPLVHAFGIKGSVFYWVFKRVPHTDSLGLL